MNIPLPCCSARCLKTLSNSNSESHSDVLQLKDVGKKFAFLSFTEKAMAMETYENGCGIYIMDEKTFCKWNSSVSLSFCLVFIHQLITVLFVQYVY